METDLLDKHQCLGCSSQELKTSNMKVMKLLLTFWITLLIALSTASGVELKPLLEQIEKAKALSLETFRNDPAEYLPMIIVGSDSYDESSAATALITYWLYGGESSTHAELIWWRSKSPTLRSLAAALLLTGRTKENISGVPYLDATRYSAQERSSREEELQLIEVNEKQLGAALKSLVNETYSVNPNEFKDALKLRFSSY